MPRKLLIYLIVCFSFVFALSSLAQQNQDAWQWTTLSVDKKINNHFSLGVDEEFRFSNNISRLNLFYTNLGVTYKLNKYFKTTMAYRVTFKNTLNRGYSYRHRFYMDLALRYRFKKYTLAWRSRIQRQVRDIHTSEDGAIPEWYWRNKLELKYSMSKKVTPYLGTELYYLLSPSTMQQTHTQFNTVRYFTGCDYDITKVHALGLYYLIQKEYNASNAGTDYVMGVQYTVSL